MCRVESSCAVNTNSLFPLSLSLTHTQNTKKNRYILASGGADGRVFIWDTRRSGRFGCLASLDSTKTMWNSSSSDDSSQRPKKRIRQTLEMLNVPIGNHMTGKAHRGPVDSITFTPDGNYLVSVRVRECVSYPSNITVSLTP